MMMKNLEIIAQQIKNAKEEYVRWGFVNPATISNYYSMVAWNALKSRYKRYVHHVKEVAPEWETLKEVGFADNSREKIQINKYGLTRRIFLEMPHGDICF
jgi:hypothetical protein